MSKLAGISNAEELRRAVEVLCLPFGRIKAIRLLRDENHKQYWCHVELDSPNLYSSMIDKLGGMHFGGTAVFRIPLNQ